MAAEKTGKIKYIKIAGITAAAGNAALAALKITAGVISGSGALIGDGIDSCADVLVSVITLAAVKVMAKPADAEHPWGHGRAETIATAVLSFIIFSAGAQIALSSCSKLVSGERLPMPAGTAAAAALVSVAGKILLAWSQHTLGKKAGSSMLRANAKNMAGDALISAGVLAGLGISAATGSAYADAVIAALIGLWIMKTAVSIFLEANHELMDGNSDMEPYRVIARAVGRVEGASNPHRARIRRIAGLWDIDFDIDVDPECTVLEAHGIASRVEEEIKGSLENVYDIMIHIEPRGDSAAEAYGLSAGDMGENFTEV